MIFFNKNSLSQRLYAIFSSSLDKKVFPGASVGISQWNGSEYCHFYNHYGQAQSFPVNIKLTRETFYDLASLTKALATVPALLSLMEEGKISWNSTLFEIFGNEIKEDKKHINIKQLMSHSSGLPAHKEYYKKLLKIKESGQKKWLFTSIIQEKLIYSPGTNNVYSDLGFILLGFIIEKISEKNLKEYIEEKIYKPLNIQKSLFYGKKGSVERQFYAATGICPWTGEMLSGKVHDDNCRALGGVAGHAGLFGTIGGVVHWCEHLLSHIKGRTRHPFFGNEILRQAMIKVGNSSWTSGFDTPSIKESSSGRFFSPLSVGHLGYTGTSFWIDPQKELIVVLLTNRVHLSANNNELIRKFRPLFHDTIMRCLQKENNKKPLVS
ncbi:MAG: serine hydrolase [Proteobacteria bacterium]|nr:serine hydrolase [Pseudomonadota bacterium]MBU1648197.1 serine hydrolase [Pseudomonadota bacterium]